ncbi:acetylornithine aminotransferase, partial [Coemansia sp. S2]
MSSLILAHSKRLLATGSSRLLALQGMKQSACSRLYHATAAAAMASPKAIEDTEKFMLNTYARPALVLSHGKGSYVYDTTGREYLDFTAGIAVTALGHSHPEVAAVVADQATKLVHCSNLYHNEWAPTLAQRIVTATTEAYPQGTQGIYAKDDSGARVFFSNS